MCTVEGCFCLIGELAFIEKKEVIRFHNFLYNTYFMGWSICHFFAMKYIPHFLIQYIVRQAMKYILTFCDGVYTTFSQWGIY
jgi:hypothetical protein